MTAGKAAGGDVLTITGRGFQAGMTSALGSVGSITSTSCTITTNAGSAGSFLWTLTVSGQSAPNQVFTYLAVPSITSISPNTWVNTSTTTVTITCSGNPTFAVNSGASLTATIGGIACTGITIVNGTQITATTPTGPTGVQNVVVTVDGVGSGTSGNGLWTWNAGATISAVVPDVGSSAGGTPAPVITGTNFNGTLTALTIGGVDHSGVATVTNTTTITLSSLLAGSMNAFSTVSLTIAGSTATYGNGTTTGFTYLPPNYHQWRADLGITFGSGSSVSAWADQGDLTATTAAQGTGANQPVQATGSSGQKALDFNNTGPFFLVLNRALIECNATSATPNITVHYFTIQELTTSSGGDGDSFGTSNDCYFPFNVISGTANIYEGQFTSLRPETGQSIAYTTLSAPHCSEICAQGGNAGTTASPTWLHFINGTSLFSTTNTQYHTQSQATAVTRIGNNIGNPTTPFKGKKYEIFAFARTGVAASNHPLSTAERSILVTYINGRYGMSMT